MSYMPYVVIALLSAVVMIQVRIHRRFKSYERSTKEFNKEQISYYADQASHGRRVMKALERSSGGIHKRIAETQEVATAIRQHQPDLFTRVPSLIYWLTAEYEFLCNVRDQAFPEGKDSLHDESRRHFASVSRGEIFRPVRDQQSCETSGAPLSTSPS